jgi:hypothetical protein
MDTAQSRDGPPPSLPVVHADETERHAPTVKTVIVVQRTGQRRNVARGGAGGELGRRIVPSGRGQWTTSPPLASC